MSTNYIRKAARDIRFSAREREALELVARGLKNREIMERMGLSSTAAENYIRVVKSKLNLLAEKWSRPQFVEAAKRYLEGGQLKSE